MDQFEIYLDLPYKKALELVEAALKHENFGAITRIDVQKTMKAKLGVDFRPYTIIGACNPPIAHRALEHDPRIGLQLPCNVSVETTPEGKTLIRIADPAQTIACSEDNDQVLIEIADETRKLLMKVADLLRGDNHNGDENGKSWERLNSLTDL
jgi:uncharacterized protein (DUF302 family)